MTKNHCLIASSASWEQQGNQMVEKCQQIGGGNAPADYENLNVFISKAIMASYCETDIAIIKIGDGAYATEWDCGNGTVICYANINGELAATIRKGKLHQNIPTLGSAQESFDTSSVLAALFRVYAEAKNINPEVESIVSATKIAPILFEVGNDFIKWLQDNVSIANGAIDSLSRRRIDSGALSGQVLSGQPIILTGGQSSAKKATGLLFADVCKKYEEYRLSQSWNEEQKERIPKFPDDFIVPKEVDEIASWFIDSRNSKLEANNFMWRGITGCGKSTGVAVLAAVLGKPLYIMTCHTTMETQDFLSALIPATGNTATELPTFEDMEFDPDEAYFRITGKRENNISYQDVLTAYAEAYASKISKNPFKRVNSEFIQGLEVGGIVEIQEPSRIRDTGVLVGLNEYAHSGARIPLIDGSYAYRSPNAITVWTDNTGYASCRTIDASVLRRMSAIFDVNVVDKKKTIDRMIYNIGDNTDPDMAEKLFDVWKAIRDYCIKEEIEGDISPSDLENWTARCHKKGIAYALELCRICVISKASTDADIQNTIEAAIAAPMISTAFGST